MAKLKFLGTSSVTWKKNEDGDKIRHVTRYGDEVDVSNDRAEALLKLEVGGRPMYERVEDKKSSSTSSSTSGGSTQSGSPSGGE